MNFERGQSLYITYTITVYNTLFQNIRILNVVLIITVVSVRDRFFSGSRWR